MNGRQVARWVIIAVLALLVAGLLLGQFLGQPILLGYVETGSMEPTIGTGDGFVAIPSALTGSPGEGDIVVFEAREINDGELTTHRIVGETEGGYLTRGDDNPFTDQDAGEPPVTDGRIVATAAQINGNAVTIPYLGTVVMGIQHVFETGYNAVATLFGIPGDLDGEGLGATMVGIGVALLGLAFAMDRVGPGRRDTSRSRNRDNVVAIWVAIGLVLVVLVTLATAAMVIPSGTTEYGLVTTDQPTDDPQIVAPGETTAFPRSVENAGYLPVVTIQEATSPGVEVDPSSQTVGPRSGAETTVTMTAPSSEGSQVRTVTEYQYLLVAPPSMLVALHNVHPFVAVGAVNAVIVGLAVALIIGLYGRADLRLRRPGSHVPLTRRIERKLRKWR